MNVQEALDIVEDGVGYVSFTTHAKASYILAEEVKRLERQWIKLAKEIERLEIRIKELESMAYDCM